MRRFGVTDEYAGHGQLKHADPGPLDNVLEAFADAFALPWPTG